MESAFVRWCHGNNTLRVFILALSLMVVVGLNFLKAHPSLLQFLAWLSFFCTFILLWLQPARRARAYADAWRMLDDAYGRYKVGVGYPIENVYDARKEGEKLISATDPT
jgi:hypothetical protein